MKRTLRVNDIEKQDELRRKDTLKMSPAERMLALIEMRDRMFPYHGLERIVTIRRIF